MILLDTKNILGILTIIITMVIIKYIPLLTIINKKITIKNIINEIIIFLKINNMDPVQIYESYIVYFNNIKNINDIYKYIANLRF